jgi:hypothetical protein
LNLTLPPLSRSVLPIPLDTSKETTVLLDLNYSTKALGKTTYEMVVKR